MSLIGPINSGTAAGSAGSATANNTTTTIISGRVVSLYVKYNDSPPAGTTDVTIQTLGTSPSPPTRVLLTLTNAATDGYFQPSVPMHDNAGAAVTFDGTNELYVAPYVHDKIKVTIAQANSGDSVDVWLMVEDY